ncbi:hypothetical protein [Nonomuraea sp. SYSU D8015]|uniref:hypothetical protein n=1 Tax=Nonomuraea sp. SYSU D8015 TaxID=2593644 RepID=UPI001660EE2D|nr:hypothetical protein [Nonomuraea sp. SYSU D8015]
MTVPVAVATVVVGTALPVAAEPDATRRRTVSVLQFGAVPADGRDDSAAMQAAADHLCAHPGTTLLYPPGVYNIDKIVDLATQFSTDLRAKSILYQDCRDVEIRGRGAKIEVKGDFEKRVSETACSPDRKFMEADKFQFTPFAFQNANDLTISGFEIDGNVEQMTQSDLSVTLCERNEYGFSSSAERASSSGISS